MCAFSFHSCSFRLVGIELAAQLRPNDVEKLTVWEVKGMWERSAEAEQLHMYQRNFWKDRIQYAAAQAGTVPPTEVFKYEPVWALYYDVTAAQPHLEPSVILVRGSTRRQIQIIS